jgi:hypothetical protein
VPRNSNTVHKVKARDPKSVAISTNKEGTTNNKIEKEKNRGRSPPLFNFINDTYLPPKLTPLVPVNRSLIKLLLQYCNLRLGFGSSIE